MRPSRVEIDLAAVAHNVGVFLERIAPAGLIAVVKANAYGHGDVPVAEAALDAGASWLAVAMVEEAARLREAGIDAPILLLSEPPAEDASEIGRWDLIPSVYRPEFVEALAASVERPTPVHLLIDTGMHRVGVAPDRAVALAEQIVGTGNLRLAGVWSHFAVAEADEDFSRLQREVLSEAVAAIEAAGIDPGIVHLPNTAGSLYIRPDSAMARVGLGLYGLHPDPSRPVADLRPAMRVVSRVSFTQRLPAGARPSYGRRRPLGVESNVATVPIGYADGVPRLLSQRGGEVLIGGRRRPFAGTVTMDQIVIDCGDDEVAVGDEVVLIGRQGDEQISADEWAERTDTISWEIVCGIGDRLPRAYRR
jgi:alanine racemase